MGFVEVMRERGMIAQITHEEELIEHLSGKPRTAYIGFDPSAESLHVGSMTTLMALKRWQDAGHRVIGLIGGVTGMVGDPTGKTEMRKMLEAEQLVKNCEGIKSQIESFLDFSTPEKGILVNNADWLSQLNYLEFIREIGPHFSVNRMLTAECFKQRLEKGLSFLEFNYMLLQSYDFLHLFKNQECTVQLGGDDQWSNILAGMELVRRFTTGKAYCLTLPLLETSDGRKMGKTESGAVWLDGEKCSPYEYFQFWRNIEDVKLDQSLKFFTELPTAEINDLVDQAKTPINDAKTRLAFECTKILHGEAAAQAAQETAKKLFSGGDGAGAGTGTEPEVLLNSSEFGDGLNIVELLVIAEIFPSKGEVRRLIKQGGLAINGKKVENINQMVTETDFDGDQGCLIKKGKKYYYRLRITK